MELASSQTHDHEGRKRTRQIAVHFEEQSGTKDIKHEGQRARDKEAVAQHARSNAGDRSCV